MKNALSISPTEAMPTPKGKGSKKSDSANRGELNNIGIEMTENGCIVRCSFDPAKLDPKQSRYDQMPEDEKYSFDDVAKAAKYVEGMMTGAAKAEASEEKAEKPAEKKK